jgi:lipoprotein-anchoring transpeptidase ErfK/SrfK
MSELKVWRSGLLSALLVAAIAVAGCSPSAPKADGTPPASQPAPPTTPPSGPIRLGSAPAYVALATRDVTVRNRPRGGQIVALFPAMLPWGSPTPFLVRAAHRDTTGDDWLKVLLPRRPNESTGWVRRDQVRLVATGYQVEVDLSDRSARLLHHRRTVRRWRVGVGRPFTPTPTGQFFVTVKLRPPQISTVYGAWALGLSGYSEVLEQFGTGDGQIALHGTGNAGDLGREVSNGCVRMDNQIITDLARTLPLGTPVTIRA